MADRLTGIVDDTMAFIKEQSALIASLRLKVEELERERDELDFLLGEGGTWEQQLAALEDQNRGLEAATIEKCANLLDDRAQEYNRIRDPGMANHCRSLASRIRALASIPGEAGNG